MQLRGVSSINMDAKGRMVLPVRFREALMAASDGHLVVTIDMEERCLLLYPLAEWEGIQQQLEAMPNVDPRARRLQRLLIGHATDLDMDANGRVLLPAELRDFAGLTKRLVLLGQGRKLEIWAEELWSQRRDEWLGDTGSEALDASSGLATLSL